MSRQHPFASSTPRSASARARLRRMGFVMACAALAGGVLLFGQGHELHGGLMVAAGALLARDSVMRSRRLKAVAARHGAPVRQVERRKAGY